MNFRSVKIPFFDNLKAIMDLNIYLKAYTPITLADMEDVKLMKRFDTKYLMNIADLPDILKAASSSYKILEIGGKRISRYLTYYYDTDTLHMYQMHHNGCLNRYKIRKRTYMDSDLHFLEVKYKSNKGKTFKKRKSLDEAPLLTETSAQFIKDCTPYCEDELLEILTVAFSRITLVNISTKERVTIDIDLNFSDNKQSVNTPSIVIIEIKKEKRADNTVFCSILKEHKIYPFRISKYCTGLLLLYKNTIKYNRFKEKIRKLEEISHGNIAAI